MSKNQSSKLVGLILLLLFISNFTHAQTGYKVKEIPNPKDTGTGYVSNPDGILSSDEVLNLDTTITGFEKKTNVEIAVVIVNDFDHEQEDFDFALNLFNTWGIGKKSSNNGLLLFIAKNRRKYRFITGTGVEGVLPDVKLKHIAENYLIPAFREDDFGRGIINTINAIGTVILNPGNNAELNQLFTQKKKESPWTDTGIQSGIVILIFSAFLFHLKRKTPTVTKSQKNNISKYDWVIGKGCLFIFLFIFVSIFIIAFSGFNFFDHFFKVNYIPIYLYILLSLFLLGSYLGVLSKIRKQYLDEENFGNAVANLNKSAKWYILFSPLILIFIIIENKKKAKLMARFKPLLDSKGQEMKRVNRDENYTGKPYLNKGQLNEEKLKSVLYDIWLNDSKSEKKLIANEGEYYKDYELCPSCGFRTYTIPEIKTITKATYTREGKGKEIQECENCAFETFIKNVDLPMLVRESSGSSSSSSSNSSSSSSSGSSSWGGGSSSGGGTGGSW